MLEESNPIPSSAGGANKPPKSVLDEGLIDSARSDREAFIELYRLHVASVYGYYVLRVGPAIAEDLTAEVFLRALEAMGRFDTSRSFRSWLFGIARNVAFEHYRKSRSDVPLDDEAGELRDESSYSMSPIEDRVVTAQLILQLDDLEQEIVALRFQGGLSYREIGSLIGKREGAVRVQMHRILSKLRSVMEGQS